MRAKIRHWSGEASGMYHNGRLEKPLPTFDGVEYEPDIEPRPRCVKCGTQLVQRTSKYGSFWGCGNYPHCRFTLSDEVVLEAIRRQKNKVAAAHAQLNTGQ